MEEEIEIISQTILEFQDSGRTSNDALAIIIIGNLEKNGYKLKKLSQHDVIKNEVAVCPSCGCNQLQDDGGNYRSCLNVLCEWKGQTVL
jgi:hypothetical protein